MQRWNGWGDDAVSIDLSHQALKMLNDSIGEGRACPDYPLEKFIEGMPESRLTEHPLISSDAKLRLDHAHGQIATVGPALKSKDDHRMTHFWRLLNDEFFSHISSLSDQRDCVKASPSQGSPQLRLEFCGFFHLTGIRQVSIFIELKRRRIGNEGDEMVGASYVQR